MVFGCGRIVILPQHAEKSFFDLKRSIEEHKITHINFLLQC